jgi:plastocyanin
MQKVEGHVSFHTALSTAFPQPAPGTAAGPGPMKVAPEKLRSVLGISDATFVPGRGMLAIVDATLSGERPDVATATIASGKIDSTKKAKVRGPNEVGIDNFQFTPPALTVKPGTTVTWVNDDDMPHLIASADGKFKSSPLLDTNGRFSVKVEKPGTYSYFCSLHPKMQGKITVAG